MMSLISHFNTTKYRHAVNSYDVLKCLAVILMTLDHIGSFFDTDNMWLRVVGRCCVPIWFFFVGYARPSSPKRELYWLAGVMIVADIIMVSGVFAVNILVTIMVTRIVIAHMATRDKDWFMMIIFMLSCLLTMPMTLPIFEYGSQVFPFALAGYYCRLSNECATPKHWLGCSTLAIACGLFAYLQYVSFDMTPLHGIVMTGGLITVCVLLQRFRYIEYPALSHIIILSPVMRCIGRNTQYYYTFHYIMFLGIYTLMHPPVAWHFLWIAEAH